MWKTAEPSQALGVQKMKGSGTGLLTHALLPCSLQWGTSYCSLTKSAVLLLFQSCKGRNQHASSCCFFQRLLFNSEKKGQIFFFPSVKHCSISCWCTNQHKLSWMNRLHVISSNSGNPWAFSVYPTCALLESPGSHCIFCRGEGWADTGRKELCIAEDQVVQLKVVCRGSPADGWSCSSYWPLSHFHGGVEQELILGQVFLGMRRKGLTNGQCN